MPSRKARSMPRLTAWHIPKSSPRTTSRMPPVTRISLRLGHDIDDPAGHDNHLAHRQARRVAGIVGMPGRLPRDLFLPGVGRDLHPEAGLPVDLDWQRDHL